MKTIGEFFTQLFILIIALLVTLFKAYVIVDVIELYSVPILSMFSTTDVWIIIMMVRLAVFSGPKDKVEMNFEDKIWHNLSSIFSQSLLALLAWGIVYLLHFILI